MTLKMILRRLTLTMVSAFSLLHVSAQTNEDAAALANIAAHRAKQEAEFRDPEKSPLSKEDFKTFRGLNYFPPDLKYRVKARFVKNEKPELFKMKTSTTRLPNYRKYATVYFMWEGQEYSLEVYQSPDLIKMATYEDYLFIPFTDKTNGHETYDVGRYLEFRIPESEEVYLDFNLCYNPYCSYDDRFSCPIPPAVNDLPIEIRAGELKFKEH